MKINLTILLAIFGLSAATTAQMPSVIPLSSEPHHHLALHNDYVNVYEVEVTPHDTVQLHRHDFDAISVMISDAQVSVRTPDKPEVHLKLAKGQVRLQPRGYTHSTFVEGDTIYRNVTIELLLPQQAGRNLCAPVIAAQPLNCPGGQTQATDAATIAQPLFETDQTRVVLIRVPPHQAITTEMPGSAEFIVALDSAVVRYSSKNVKEESLRPGGHVWGDAGAPVRIFRNDGGDETRLIQFLFKVPPQTESVLITKTKQ